MSTTYFHNTRYATASLTPWSNALWVVPSTTELVAVAMRTRRATASAALEAVNLVTFQKRRPADFFAQADALDRGLTATRPA